MTTKPTRQQVAEREMGWYWVKWRKYDGWTFAEYTRSNGFEWWNGGLIAPEFIHSKRILPPEEE